MDITDPSYAEGRVYDFQGEDKIASHLLQTFPYQGELQKITYETKEFSAVCPFSGLPDIAYVSIVYIPAQKIVELKSLKYYFVSYRNVGIYQEHATNRIYRDLKKVLEPKRLVVKTIYNTRGGIDAACEIDSDQT
ncbi:MAG: preQ(1) synthase [Deltaproteobacteria bacterium]|nr:preQ(1) synthase [Deltaproteobacteria bacterium]